jgi:hypothetical protein
VLKQARRHAFYHLAESVIIVATSEMAADAAAATADHNMYFVFWTAAFAAISLALAACSSARAARFSTSFASY